MIWNTEFFGQPSFRQGLLAVAGFLDVGGIICHYPQNIYKYIKAMSFFLQEENSLVP